MSTVIPFRSKTKTPVAKTGFEDLVQFPTEAALTGFLTTIDYLRTLSSDDDVDVSLDGGELFLKIRSYHDYTDKNGIESAVKMEKVASTMMIDGNNDVQIGDLVTKQNIELLIKLLKQVDFDADADKENEID